MYCGYCGKSINENTVYCGYCGRELNPRNIPLDINVKPDKQITKYVTKNAADFISNIRGVISDYEHKEHSIRKNYQVLKNETIHRILSTTPIEELNKIEKGMRLSSLNYLGLNISKVLRMSVNHLVSYPGIGQQTAIKLKNAAAEYERAVINNTTPKLEYENRSKAASDIVYSIFATNKTKSDYAELKEFEKSKSKILSDNLSKAKIAGSKIRWFFAFKSTKINSIQSLEYLRNYINSIEKSNIEKFSQEYFNKINETNIALAWEDFKSNSVSYYSVLESITGNVFNRANSKGGLPKNLIEKIESQPLDTSLMKSSLRGYQEFGAKYAIAQKYSLIGDEMGLGKTVEAIAAIAHLQAKGDKYFFVVCPASVLVNWFREISKHSHLNAYKIHGDDKRLYLQEWQKNGGVGITTYETLKTIDFSKLDSLSILIVDEAHYAKNHSAQRTQAIIALKKRAEHIVYMTGTPLENKIEEMQSLILQLNPGVARELNSYSVVFDTSKFREKVAPVYLRRNRDDVLSELPELIEIEEWVDFGPEEEMMYQDAVREGKFMLMRRVAWLSKNPSDSSKLGRLMEICEDARENDRKVLVFSFFRSVIDVVQEALGDFCVRSITGSVSPGQRQNIIDEFTGSSEKNVLICQVQAGGVGLNIQAASVVVFCEPQIKPALESQAISRSYRMGQINKVVVHRLLTEDSVDERMMELLYNKEQIFDLYARHSVVAERSAQAVDKSEKSEKSIMSEIVFKEQERLGFSDRVLSENLEAEE